MAQNIELLYSSDLRVTVDQNLSVAPLDYTGPQLYKFTFLVENFGVVPSFNTGFVLVESSQTCPVIGFSGILWEDGELFEDYLAKIRTSIYTQLNSNGLVVRDGNLFTVVSDDSFLPIGVSVLDCNNLFTLKSCVSGNISVTIIRQPECVSDPYYEEVNRVTYGYPNAHTEFQNPTLIAKISGDFNLDNYFIYQVTNEFLGSETDAGTGEFAEDCADSASVAPVIRKYLELEYSLDSNPFTLQFLDEPNLDNKGTFLDLYKSIRDVRDNVLPINIGFVAEVDGAFTQTLQLIDGSDGHIVAEIRLYAETIAEDERLDVLLKNIGQDINEEDVYIFKNADVFEEKPDYQILNEKRKEFLLELDSLVPYVGSYKSLINAIKFYGYSDSIRLRELWENVDVLSENFGKFYPQEVALFDKVLFKRRRALIDSRAYRKTTKFSLAYSINRLSGNFDISGLPETEPSFLFTNEEILIKLYGLKKKLSEKYLPVNAKIVDITGEALYFTKFNISTFTSQNEYNVVDQQIIPKFETFKQKGWIQDLRPLLNAGNFINVPPNITPEIELDAATNTRLDFPISASNYRIRAIYGNGLNSVKSTWSGFNIYQSEPSNLPVASLWIDNDATTKLDGEPGYTLKLAWIEPTPQADDYQIQFKRDRDEFYQDYYDGIDGLSPRFVVGNSFTIPANPALTYGLPQNIANSYTILEVEAYNFRVRARYGSTYSDWVYTEFSGLSYNKLASPIQQIQTSIDGGFINLSWEKPVNYTVQGYEIENRLYENSTNEISGTITGNPIPLYRLWISPTLSHQSPMTVRGNVVWGIPVSQFSDDLVAFFNNYDLSVFELEDSPLAPAGYPAYLKNTSFNATFDDFSNVTFDEMGVFINFKERVFTDLTETIGSLRAGIFTSETFIPDVFGELNRFKIFLKTPAPLGAPPFVCAPYPGPSDDLPDGCWQETFVADPNSDAFVVGKEPTILRLSVNGFRVNFRLVDKSISPIVNPPELSYLIGNGVSIGDTFHEFVFELLDDVGLPSDRPDEGSLLEVLPELNRSRFYTLDTAGAGNYFMLAWEIEKTFPLDDRIFKYYIEGDVISLSELLVILPFTVKYRVKLTLFDGTGAKNETIRNDYFIVESQKPDVLAFSKIVNPEYQTFESPLTFDETEGTYDTFFRTVNNSLLDTKLSPLSLNANKYMFSKDLGVKDVRWGNIFSFETTGNLSFDEAKYVRYDNYELNPNVRSGFKILKIAAGGSLQINGFEPYLVPRFYYYSDEGSVVGENEESELPTDRPIFSFDENSYLALAELLNNETSFGLSDFAFTARPIPEPKQPYLPTYIDAVSKFDGTNGNTLIGFANGLIGDVDFDKSSFDGLSEFTIEDIQLQFDHMELVKILRGVDNSLRLTELSVFDNTIEAKKGVPLFIVTDNSGIPGKNGHEWLLYDDETGEELLQVNNVDYFLYTFVREGRYGLKITIRDTNGNSATEEKRKYIFVD